MAKEAMFEGRKVLVVDDQPIIHKMLEGYLSKLGFAEVDSVESGSKALKALDKKSYDLIMCDIRMDGLDGIEFVQTLRHSANLRFDAKKASTPVIFMSGSSDPAYLRGAKEVGAQGYLLKPFNPSDVHARLTKVFGTQ